MTAQINNSSSPVVPANTVIHPAIKTDQGAVLEFLTALGYAKKDTLHFRSFFPSDDPRHTTDKGRKIDSLDFRQIEIWQNEGRGVYLVVNGGGDKDEDIKLCRAIFYEHDKLPKEEQLGLWEKLGLPAPTIQVDTGGKSIHSYWVFEELIPVEDWRELQADLLDFSDGDRVIKNPSRVMRLPGAWHISTKGVFQSKIVSNSSKRYAYDELRNRIPPRENKTKQAAAKQTNFNRFAGWNSPSSDRPNRNWTRTDWALYYLKALSPLRADDYESWLHVGMILKAIDESLFHEWELWSMQSSKYKPGLCANKWESFKSTGLNIGTLAQMAKEDGLVIGSSKFRNSGGEILSDLPTGKNFQSKNKSGSQNGGQPPFNELSLRDRIIEIQTRALSKSEQKIAFIELEKSTGTDLRKIEDLAKLLEQETDNQDDHQIVKKAIPSLLECQKAQLNPEHLFWGDKGKLATLLSSVADGMPTSVEALISTLIPVAGSRIGTSSRIVINPQSRYTQPAIYRTCIVAESGRKKTPAQKIIIDPLDRMEADEYHKSKQAKNDFKELLKAAKKGDDIPDAPSPRKRFILLNGSIESRIKIHSENPRGLLLYKDEWSAHFSSRNKYRSGIGDDTEIELSEFNGGSLSKDVVDDEKCLYLERSAISRTGSTQVETLKGIMSDHNDSSGEFARWLFCIRPSLPSYINLFSEDNSGDSLNEYLRLVYERIGRLPEKDYFFDSSAKAVFQDCQHQLVNWTVEEIDQGLKTAYPKFESYFGRFALWLHLVNATLAGDLNPAQYIGAETVATAWTMVEFYIAQLKLVYALNSPHQVTAGRILKLRDFITTRTEGVDLRQIKGGCRALKKVPTEEIRQDCQFLVDEGEIIFRDKKYYPHSKNVDVVDAVLTGLQTERQQSEITLNQDFDTTNSTHVGIVDAVGTQKNFFTEPLDDPWGEEKMVNSSPNGVNNVNNANRISESIDIACDESVDVFSTQHQQASTSSTPQVADPLPQTENNDGVYPAQIEAEQPETAQPQTPSENVASLQKLKPPNLPVPYEIGELIEVVNTKCPFRGVVIKICEVKVTSYGIIYIGTLQRARRKQDKKCQEWQLSHDEVRLVER